MINDKTVLLLTDWDVRGSGYRNIMEGLCDELMQRGWVVKVLGVAADYREHEHDFTIIPVTVQDAYAQAQVVLQTWRPTYFVVALDLPHQTQFIQFNSMAKYIGIFPLESDPLPAPTEYSAAIERMHAAFGISEHTVRECVKAGVLDVMDDAVALLRPGIQSDVVARPDGRARARAEWGIDDKFVVTTVADNHERKCLSICFAALHELSKTVDNLWYIIVTKERPDKVGWRLWPMIKQYGLRGKVIIYEGSATEETLPAKSIADVYAASDAFLLLSNAEGLGLPVLEAMINRVPVVCTDACALADHVADGRGLPVRVAFKHQGPFLNGYKYFADAKDAAKKLLHLHDAPNLRKRITGKAYKYAQGWTFEAMADQFEKVLNDKKSRSEQDSGEAALRVAAPVSSAIPDAASSTDSGVAVS